jgi:hypothetical protein
MASAKIRLIKLPTSQPMPMPAPPTPEILWWMELMPPDKMQMMENDTAKFENGFSVRESSCV